jgi:hypothetical protein
MATSILRAESARSRKRYPAERKRKGRPFTTLMWVQWLKSQPWASPSPDEREVRLRAGIDELRRRLEVLR